MGRREADPDRKGNVIMRSRFTAALAVVALVVLWAVPAMAASEQGYKDCSSGLTVWLTSETTGTTRHYAPSGTLRETFYNGVFLQRRTSATGFNNTTWKITTDGYLDGAKTFPWCYL